MLGDTRGVVIVLALLHHRVHSTVAESNGGSQTFFRIQRMQQRELLSQAPASRCSRHPDVVAFVGGVTKGGHQRTWDRTTTRWTPRVAFHKNGSAATIPLVGTVGASASNGSDFPDEDAVTDSATMKKTVTKRGRKRVATKASTTSKKKGEKGEGRSKAKKQSSLKDVLYWSEDGDEVRFEDVFDRLALDHEDSTRRDAWKSRKICKFTVRGEPKPLVRHRTARGFMYNPSAKAQRAFRNVVYKLMPEKFRPARTVEDIGVADDLVVIEDDDDDDDPVATPNSFFSPKEFVSLSIIFRLRRPRSHFVGNRAGPGRSLRETSPGKLSISGRSPDVDNLAKFVLDSLNGLLYSDDRQVVSLNVIKILDDTTEYCEGATEVVARALSEEDLDSLLMGMTSLD